MIIRTTARFSAAAFLGACLLIAAPAAASAKADAPPGQNGTIKIDEIPVDDSMANDPHVGCPFAVKFFGFDAGSLTGAATFDGVAPTGGGRVAELSESWTQAHRTSGSQLDHVIAPINLTSALQAAGVQPHSKQGYHVRVTATVTGSGAPTTKHKTFWVEPCAPAQAAAAPAAQPAIAPTAPPTASAAPAAPAAALSQPAAGSAVEGATETPDEEAGSVHGAGVPASGTSVEAAQVEPESASAGPRVLAATATRPGSLPFTGAEVGAMVLAGLVLIGAGTAAVVVGRRRRVT